MRRAPSWPRTAASALIAALALVLLPAVPATAAPGPVVELSSAQDGTGGTLTVSGSGWKPGALLMLLVCGQATPETGVIGGTNSCANSDGRATTVGAGGGFSAKLPVTAPPKPCPCVVHVAGLTGQQDAVDKVFTVTGHPTAPLPEISGTGRLAVLAAVRLDGSSGLLVWFGAPPRREIVFTVGNLGSAPVKDPVFEVGTSHGVFAPQYEERRWTGTIAPGKKAVVRLPAELTAGAHGDYQVSVRYAGKILVEQPWGVDRPWGVTLFWALLALVVPAALFRIGMAVVDQVRPSARATAGSRRRRTPARTRTRPSPSAVPAAAPAAPGAPADPDGEPTTVLPWFSPDSAPSAPESSSPTRKGQA